MIVKILGSAAGGGFPQWNCACHNCQGLRRGSLRAAPRTQTQLVFSPDGQNWFLACASPDLRSQIIGTPELAPLPDPGSRSPIAGIFLPSADVDCVIGLFHLREFQTFSVFATPGVQHLLTSESRIFRVVERADPPLLWRTISSNGRLDWHFSSHPADGPAFTCTTFPLGGSYPDYASQEFCRTSAPDDCSVGFVFESGGKKVFFAPSVSGRNSEWTRFIADADVVLIDGTFWSEDELIRTGRSRKNASEIGHLALSGPNGLLARFPRVSARKILIHINNTNPILDEESVEHRCVREAGFEIAYDGLAIRL
jgi:pyrroloquinoline quinone biosynthesis protein B